MSTILNPNPTEKTGSFSPLSGITAKELRVKQIGKVVEVHFYAEKSSEFGTSAVVIGRITGVELPPTTIRTVFGADVHAYDVNRMAYAYIGTNGDIAIRTVNASDTVVLVDFVYTVD